MNTKKLGDKIGIKWENVAFTSTQFGKGVKAETKEHHDDPETKVINTNEEAGKIAWAHLKEDPKYYDKLAKMEENSKMEENKDPIFGKIEEGTVTTADFNRLISEATPEAARDRNRRRVSTLNTRKHLDDEGHQKIDGPTFADRVQPKREKADNTQMKHRGKSGHRASTRTQQRKAQAEGRAKKMNKPQPDIFESQVPEKYKKSLKFIMENIGKPITNDLLNKMQDKQALNKLASRMMTRPDVDRNWLGEIVRRTHE